VIRRCAALAVILALLPTLSRAGEVTLFPGDWLDCIVRPKDVIELTSAEDGVLAAILVDRGQVVTRGQVVARLDSRLQESAVELARIRAENQAANAASQARLEFRQNELSRMQKLYRKRVAAQALLDEAEVELNLAALDLESSAAELKLAAAELAQAEILVERRLIRSPTDGVVFRITASPGEYAHEQAPVMTIAELDPLHVEAYLPIDLFPRLTLGQQAEIQIGAPFDLVRTAKVSAIDTVFDAASGTFGVRLDLLNADRQLPSGIKCSLRFSAMAEGG
jgi:RND family efflux transporter MFP subunit